MAVTARFLADFSSFQDAVAKAEVSLKGFESEAGKVEKSLNKMGDAFSGRKVVQDAELATKAVMDLGGATKLTESEQLKLNAQLNEAIAKYKALGLDAPAAMVQLANDTKKVETAMEGAAKPTSAFVDYFKGAVAGMITATAVIGTVKSAIRGLSEFIGSSVDAYAEQETAIKKMTVALRAQGNATPEVIQQYKDLASTFQNTTAFSDELVNEMQALLTQVGNVMPREMEGALKAATDLSVGLGIDLRDATIIVAKAFEGNTTALKKMGIEAKDGATAIEAINEKFGGQAAAEIETYAGRVKQLANAWGEVKEALGKSIVQDPILIAGLSQISEAVKSASNAADGASPNFLELWATFAGVDSATLSVIRMTEALTKMYQVAGHPPPAPNLTAPTRPNQFGKDLIDVPKYLKGAEEATKRLAAETAHLKSVQDEIFGANLKRAAQDYTNAVGAISNLSRVNSVEQEKINKSIGEALDVYKRFGQVAPQAMRDLFIATSKMPDAIAGIPGGIAQIGTQFELVTPKITDVSKLLTYTAGIPFGVKVGQQVDFVVPKVEKFKANLGDLSRAMSELATISGGTFGTIASGLATLVSAANTAQKAITGIKDAQKALKAGEAMEGILGMATGIAGLVTAAIAAGQAIKSLFGLFDRNKGRDLVVDFAESFGGFDQLHDKLLMLGADGEALWIKLTQGVGRNNPQQAQRVIDEVNQALDEQAQKQDEATTATEEQAQATIETATQAALALDELGGKLDISKQQWKDWGAVVTGELQALALSIRSLPLPSPGGESSLSFGAGSRSGATTIRVPVYLDGSVITESVARDVMTS